MQTVLLISNLAIAVLDMGVLIYCICYFMSKTERNQYRRRGAYVLATISLVLGSAVATVMPSTIISIPIMLGMIVLIGHFLYNDSRMYIFYYIVLGVMIFVIQFVIMGFFSIFLIQQGMNENYGLIYSDVIMLIKQLAELVVIRIYTELVRRRSSKKVDVRQLLSFLILPVISIIFMLTLSSFANLIPTTETILTVTLNVILLAALNLYVITSFDKMVSAKELEAKVGLYEQKSQMQMKYYKELEEKQEETRKLVHDMRNHLLTMERLYEQNPEGDAGSYLQDMHQMLNELGQQYYLANKVVNVILNDKKQLAKTAQLDMNITVREVDFLYLKPMDATALFANLIDNAIEAAKQTDDKKVDVRLDHFHGYDVICVENSCQKPPNVDNGRYISDKTMREGIGLQNVKRVVEQYHGTITMKYETGQFQVSVTLPEGGRDS